MRQRPGLPRAGVGAPSSAEASGQHLGFSADGTPGSYAGQWRGTGGSGGRVFVGEQLPPSLSHRIHSTSLAFLRDPSTGAPEHPNLAPLGTECLCPLQTAKVDTEALSGWHWAQGL